MFMDIDIKKEWIRMQKVMHTINSAGGFSQFATKHESEITNSFVEPKYVCCIDERIPHNGSISIAGSGILIKDNPEIFEIFVKYLKQKEIKQVRMHEDCGAVGLYAQEKNISIEKANKESLQWAQELTNALGGSSLEISEVLPVDIGFHNALCAYIIFDNLSIPKDLFPRGFEINASCVQFPQVLEQVAVSVDIALGHHGFGVLFTKDNPFTIVTVTKNGNDMDTTQGCNDLAQTLKQYGDRIATTNFSL